MTYLIRLRRREREPRPLDSNETLFAAADGTLKHMDPDGTVTDLGGSNGGSQPGAAIVRGPFAFAFDTPGLNNGVAFYTPTIGDILLDAWIEVDTAFNGTTPRADLGQFVGATNGLFYFANPLDLTRADEDNVLAPSLLSGNASPINLGPGYTQSGNIAAAAVAYTITGGELDGARLLPGKFTTADPMLLVVSQDGSKGGTAVGGSAGAGKVYIVTATPAAFS